MNKNLTITIHDLEDYGDLVNAVGHILQVMLDADQWDRPALTFSKAPAAEPIDGAPTRDEADPDGSVQQILDDMPEPLDETGPTPYIPCPHRGEHLKLTDCWMCWSDVHRGAVTEVDVLHPAAWEIGLRNLAAADRAAAAATDEQED